MTKINAHVLRKPYGSGRVPMKISLTEETLNRLCELGIVERVQNRQGKLVAKKGGAGSSFAEFSMSAVSTLTDSESSKEDIEKIADDLRLALGEDGIPGFIRNLYSLDEILNP
jgi:hypothetical protein